MVVIRQFRGNSENYGILQIVGSRKGTLLKKILFCNLDLLVKKFQELDPENSLKNRNEFLEY